MGKNFDELYAKETEYKNLSTKAGEVRKTRIAKEEELKGYTKDEQEAVIE